MKIIECPRDAMQGIRDFIPTTLKAGYLNLLLNVGFDTLDFGSFVSPKAIPQMRDTTEVLEKLDLKNSRTKLLAIVANPRGASDASLHQKITYLGYPFSISETFQKRNTNRTISEAFEDVKKIAQICDQNNKELVIYISMGFGNPYGDPWNPGIVEEWVEKLKTLNTGIFSLADTVGNAQIEDIRNLFKKLPEKFPELEFGAHFHSRPENRIEKISVAYHAGCERFDSTIKGYGGCPMAKDELVGNIATEDLIKFFEDQNIEPGLNKYHWNEILAKANEVFMH